MAVKGEARDFHNKFKFQIEFDGGLGRMQCSAISELKVSFAKIEYWEGGMVIPYKEPGRMSFDDLTIDRAATSDLSIYNWVKDTCDAVKQNGLPYDQFKKSGTIVQYGRDDSRLREWQIFGAFPLSYTAGSWDNNSDEFTMEQLVLGYDYFKYGKNVDGMTGTSSNIINPWKQTILGGQIK